jgi:predicted hydrocarbon binding protein
MSLSPFLQRLLFVKQFNIIDGKVEILGNKYIMLDAANLLVLQDIDKTRMYNIMKDGGKKSIKELVEHAAVYKTIKSQELKNIAEIAKKVGESDEGVISALQTIFEIYGLGKLKILDLNNEEKKVVLRIEKSTLAEEHKKKKGKKDKVCTLTAGILAGIFSYIFKKDVNCAEENCLAQGKQYCDMIIN